MTDASPDEPKKKKGFAASLAAAGKKNNNESALPWKIELRKKLITAMGPDNCNVFDAFAGSGEMFKGVWHQAKSYAGCDLQFYRDEREMFCCDNKRVLRAVNLNRFNLFDLDAYGMPWEQAMIVAANRPVMAGEKIGFCFTDGGVQAARLNTGSNAFTQLTGYSFQAGMSNDYERMHKIAVHRLGERMGCTVERHWLLAGKGKRMFYSTVIYAKPGAN